ncbi:hypothetical protein BDY19DRAFT_997912 [Irpex rosettiformis]|uniref:Uncharacterized protein n=1 Tax=Irpex rosettiformis TaxID=378272 RepID=A0ACB8TQF3_9APHY|nr:hypothetical protein BDY19DRAFT_997912 [Irpex rosettiformis]
MQNAEATAFLARIEQLPDGPGADLDAVLRPSLDDEAELRKLFAQDKRNIRLQDPHVGLVDIFAASPAIRTTRARVITDEKDAAAKYIMPLSEGQRRKEGTPAMVQSLDDFKKNWAIFTEGSLSQLTDWSNIIAAGGAVQACLAPLPDKATVSKRALRKHYHSNAYPASDVDLFLYGLTPEQAEVKINAIYEAVRDSIPWDATCIRTKHTVSIHSQYPYRAVQIVLRLYQSPAEVLAGFDVDAPCCAFDGGRVWANPRAIVAAMRQSNTTDITRRSPSYEVRLAKYATRNFEIHVPQLRREDIDPTIFERSIVRVQGLARLIVLEKLFTATSREQYVDARRNVRGRPSRPNIWQRTKRTKIYKGDLKDEVNAGLELSNYDVVSLHIPYGPGWDARRAEKLVYQTDLGMNSPFNPKNKGRRLHRHPAFFGTMPECLEDCCEHCPTAKNGEEKELQKEEDESYIRGRIQFIVEDPGRQSISGSFNPIDEGEWIEQAYMGPTEKFFAAIASHNQTAVVRMIKEGIDVNRRDHVGRTPLQVAALSKAVGISFDLIDANARMTSRLVDGRTVLHLAAQLDLPDLVRKLLERSAVNKEASEAEAARLDDEQAMKVDKEDDADSESIGSASERSEHSSEDDWDSDEGDGGDAKKEDTPKGDEGNIPEDETEEPDVFAIDVQDWDYGLSPLHYAIVSGSSATIDLLLASGANAKLVAKIPSGLHFSKYAQPLMLTTITEDEDEACKIVKKLLAAGAVSSEADENFATIFHRIVGRSKSKLVSALLARDPNAKAVLNIPFLPSYGTVMFPLVSAVNNGSYAMLATLLAYGAHVDISDDDLERARDMKMKNTQRAIDLSTMKIPNALEAALITYDESAYLLMGVGADVNRPLSDSRWSTSVVSTCLDYVRLLRGKITEYKKPKPTHSGSIGISSLIGVLASAEETVRVQGHSNAPAILTELSSWRKEVGRIISECQAVEAKDAKTENNPLRLDEIDEYCSGVEDLLVARNAKKASEIMPPSNIPKNTSTPLLLQPYVANIPTQYHYVPVIRNFGGLSAQFYSHVGPWGRCPVPRGLATLYDELFTACYEGDNVKIQRLCMPHGSHKTPDTPLQISAHWGNSTEGYTPLALAILARKWDTVKLILAIAVAQFSPKEQTEPKFDASFIDDSDSDSDDNEMDYEEEPINFIDIAKQHSEIRVQVPPSRMMDVAAPWNNCDAGEILWSTPIAKAIIEDDFEAFVQILSIAQSLPGNVLNSGMVLNQLLSHDRPAMLDELIRQTGEGIDPSVHTRSTKGHTTLETSSKVYLGLNVHGKKRKDLAVKGDPNAPQTYRSDIVPPVWIALKNQLPATVRYLASDQALAAYKFYASSHGDQKAKLLRDIPDPNIALPALLGWAPNAVDETPLTAAILSGQVDIVEMLFTLRPKDAQEQSQLRQLTHGFNAILAAVRWTTDPALFDFLLANGVSPLETDNDKRNIYHVLCGRDLGEDYFKLLAHIIEKLPKDVTRTLLRQQTKQSGDTPLHIAVKRQNLRAVKALTDTAVEQYLIRDLSGLTPLLAAVIIGNVDITRLIARAGPVEALTLEDGIGSTPLEIATHRAFIEKLGPAINPDILGAIRTSTQWNVKPFDVVKQQKELPRLKAAIEGLSSEGRLPKGTKLWKELDTFVAHLEERIAAELAKVGDTKEDESTKGVIDRSQTLQVLREAIEARPGFRRLVHLADVHISVNKGLEGYQGIQQAVVKYDEDEEPAEEVPRPVQTASYENQFSAHEWLALSALHV